ncbi:MAG: hypothetical protein KDA25_09820, partial [Phycisphaerales bacterium]|nr:hypothetical protein [Phycisphaerales bacterium]
MHAASGEFLLTYDANGLKARRFDADLNPIGTVFDVVGNTIASNGTEYYVAWTSGTNHVGSPMAPDGTLDFPTGRLITSTTGVSNGIDVTWGGTQWWAAWERINEGYRAARISAAGLVRDPSGVRLNVSDANLTDQLALAGGDDGSLQLAWQDRRVGSGEYDIYGAHVDADVNPSAEQILSFAAPTQLGVDLAAGADGAWMAVWRSAHSGAARILAQRVGPDGTPLDALPIELDAALALGYPSVAWDGARYLAVWSTTGGIVGRRLGADGAILDASPFDVMPGGTAEVAGLDGRFLVVGSHAPGNPQFRFAYGRRVDGATGALLDPAAMLVGPNFAQIPNVTTFDGRWLMTWQRNFTHDDVQASTEAAFVEYDGTVGPVIVVSIYGFRPQVAGGDGAALFVYGSNSPANANSDVLGRRLLPDGSMTPAFTVSSGFGKQFAPVVTWTGAEFIAAWEDRRNQNVFFDARTDIYATRIGADGTVVDPSAFMLAERVAILPALASSGGHTLFLCSDFVSEAPYASYRIGGAIVNPGPGADLDG